MKALLGFADGIDAILKRIADLGAWAFLACIAVIVVDVITRKVGYQLPNMGSTRLQELEWHLHSILFCTWLGYTYLRNGHVRIDVFTGALAPRRKIWLELICCVLFALPYLVVALPYAIDFFTLSWQQGEGSDAPNGLGSRWIVKGFLLLGFVTVFAAVLAVIARCIVALFGPQDLAAQADTPFAN